MTSAPTNSDGAVPQLGNSAGAEELRRSIATLLRSDKADEARALAQAACQSTPSAAAYSALAHVELHERRLEAALTAATAAFGATAVAEPGLYFLRARIRFALGFFTQAAQDCEDALRAAAGSGTDYYGSSLHLLAAWCWSELDRHDLATKHLASVPADAVVVAGHMLTRSDLAEAIDAAG